MDEKKKKNSENMCHLDFIWNLIIWPGNSKKKKKMKAINTYTNK